MVKSLSFRRQILPGFGKIFFFIALFSAVSVLAARRRNENAGFFTDIAYSHALCLIEVESLIKVVTGHGHVSSGCCPNGIFNLMVILSAAKNLVFPLGWETLRSAQGDKNDFGSSPSFSDSGHLTGMVKAKDVGNILQLVRQNIQEALKLMA